MNPFAPKFARSRRDVIRAAENPTPEAELPERTSTVDNPDAASGKSTVDEPAQPEVKAPKRKPVKAPRSKTGRRSKTT